MTKEFELVEKPIIGWLRELGWKYIPPEKLNRDPEEAFDLPTLKDAIRRLNGTIIKTDEDVEKIINRLKVFSNDIAGNKEFFEWIRGEKSIILRPGEKAKTIKLIDFEKPDNNDFVVTNQFEFSGFKNVRFDIVLMVNGMPLINIEAKNLAKEGLDYKEAIKQLMRYDREAPQVTRYLAFVCTTDGADIRYGWVSDNENLEKNKFFRWKGSEYEDPLEGSVRGLFEKQMFLNLVDNFVLFERERGKVNKKIAMPQQVRATNRIAKRVLTKEAKTGLIWHAQGAGKTLTMLFTAWKLKRTKQLKNPTVLVILDRVELQKQLGGVFENVDFPYFAKAKSTRDLEEKLEHESREVILTIIHKFGRIEKVLSKRKNIILLVDEAHRTQYGRFALHMREALPNAFIFGFTGTPIEKGPLGKSTFRAFCPIQERAKERYLDKYPMEEAIEDQTTVPIYYYSRSERYPWTREVKEWLDREFFSVTRTLSEEQQEEILEKSVNLKNFLKQPQRIEKIAEDIKDHFKTWIEPQGLKAQLVAVDREACALYKEALDKFLPEDWSEVIFTGSPNDTFLRKYHLSRDEQAEIAQKRFQDPKDNPRILIVTDMLLTGFDAPIEGVMYLDKPLRDHRLVQAIARTNRPYPGKLGGIVVDYARIFDNLVKALYFQEADIKSIVSDFGQLRQEWKKTLDGLLELFPTIERKIERVHLLEAAEKLKRKEKLKFFKENFSLLKKLWETLFPDPAVTSCSKEYDWLIAVKAAYYKFYEREKVNLEEYQTKTKELIQKSFLLKEIEKEIPLLEIDADYLKKVEGEHLPEKQKVMELSSALDHHIKIDLEKHPIYRTLSQRLESILKRREEDAEKAKKLIDLVKEVNKLEEERKRLILSQEEYAVFGVLKSYLPKKKEKELVSFSKDLLKDVKENSFPGWHAKKSVIQKIEKIIFEKCIERFSDLLDPRKTLWLSEELMKYLKRYSER